MGWRLKDSPEASDAADELAGDARADQEDYELRNKESSESTHR